MNILKWREEALFLNLGGMDGWWLLKEGDQFSSRLSPLISFLQYSGWLHTNEYMGNKKDLSLVFKTWRQVTGGYKNEADRCGRSQWEEMVVYGTKNKLFGILNNYYLITQV